MPILTGLFKAGLLILVGVWVNPNTFIFVIKFASNLKNLPLKAFLHESDHMSAVMKWRAASLLSVAYSTGSGLLVVPTLHPV